MKVGSAFWSRSRSNCAFNLMDLAATLAVISLLLVLLLPALAATHDRSNRAVCQYHLRQIGVAAAQYAANNNDTYFSCASSGGDPAGPTTTFQPNAIVLDVSTSAKVGLHTNGNSIWTCPDREILPTTPPVATPYWYIGYLYFGGMSNWTTIAQSPFAPRISAPSPVKLSQARPHWALAGDAMMKVSAIWTGTLVEPGTPLYAQWYFEYNNSPPHKTAGNVAQGGNEVFCDGSVQWIDLEKMYGLTSYPGAIGTVTCYWYQDPKDFPATLKSQLPILSPMPP